MKITPNFSFACGDTYAGAHVSICEQRNAAVVGTMLEED